MEGGREEEPGLPGRADRHPQPRLLSPADDDDANSYENVLICKRKDTESGEAASPGSWQGGQPPRLRSEAPLAQRHHLPRNPKVHLSSRAFG